MKKIKNLKLIKKYTKSIIKFYTFEDLKWNIIAIFIYTNYITVLVMVIKISYKFCTIIS